MGYGNSELLFRRSCREEEVSLRGVFNISMRRTEILTE
ncbi:unnamed protein product [Amoebophrya sp. A25]|nr:unnamed protein product [Amoebophrya sp. A25]|eukprot:GSA25T00002400001.1